MTQLSNIRLWATTFACLGGIAIAGACGDEASETEEGGGAPTATDTGTGTGTGGGNVGGGTPSDCAPNWECTQTQNISITTSYGAVDHCGQFYIPMNNDSESTALNIFSEGHDLFTVQNNSGATQTIESVDVCPRTGVMQEEFEIRDDSLQVAPLTISNQEIADGASFSFNVRFHPVAGKERYADVTLNMASGEKYGFTVKGRGHPMADPDTAVLSTTLTLDKHKLFGGFGNSQDEQPSGIALDSSGNVYFAGASKTTTQATAGGDIIDNFYYDLFYGKINADGTLGWHKLYATDAIEYMPDAGENDQNGSTQAVVLDDSGNPYIIGTVGVGATAQNVFAALIMKLDPSNGSPVWEQYYHPDWSRVLGASYTDSAQIFAIDFNDGRVYIAGEFSTLGSGGAFVACLNASDGALLWSKNIEPGSGADRAYAVAATGTAGSETVYVGGWSGKTGVNKPILAKLSWNGTDDYELTWIQGYEYHYASRINNLDVDSNGDVYISLDNADYEISMAKVNGSDGTIAWSKTLTDYDNGGSSEAINHAVTVDGSSVYFGGIGKPPFYDTQLGDAWVAKLATSDGAMEWLNFYHSGKSPENSCRHKVTSIAVSGSTLWLGGSVYTGNSNYYRYWGYWYDGTRDLTSETIELIDMSGTVIQNITNEEVRSLSDLQALTGQEATDCVNITGRYWGEQITDYPTNPDAPRTIEFQDADAKNETTFGAAVDKDLMFWKLTMQ